MKNRIEIIEFPYEKGILYGLPVRVYKERCEATNWFTGTILDFLTETLGFNGMLVIYEGSYWGGLWSYLFDNDLEDEK